MNLQKPISKFTKKQQLSDDVEIESIKIPKDKLWNQILLHIGFFIKKMNRKQRYVMEQINIWKIKRLRDRSVVNGEETNQDFTKMFQDLGF